MALRKASIEHNPAPTEAIPSWPATHTDTNRLNNWGFVLVNQPSPVTAIFSRTGSPWHPARWWCPGGMPCSELMGFRSR